MQRTTPPPYRPPLKRPQSLDTSTSSFVGRCPHLGTMADAGTALAFPSDANHCYRTRLPVPISNVHQQSYCLSGGYEGCPVFRQNLQFAEAIPLTPTRPNWGMPAEETVTDVVIAPSRGRESRRSPVLLGLLLVALLAAGWWLWRGFLANDEPLQSELPANVAVSDATMEPAEAVAEETAGDSAQVVAANPTATPVPNTPTPLPETQSGIALPVAPTTVPTEVPADAVQAAECTSPDWWVPYVVQTSDTLPGLAQLRGLAPADVLVGNCLSNDELTVGQIVLLPPLATVIGLTPTAFAPTVVALPVGGNSIVIVATQSPIIPASPTPLPTTGAGGQPVELPTDQPSRPAATAIAPTRVPPTATPPGLFPTATPPSGTATPPAIVPTATPPGVGLSPTQTPPAARP